MPEEILEQVIYFPSTPL